MPKPQGRKNSEARRPKPERRSKSEFRSNRTLSSRCSSVLTSGFGICPSEFFRVSASGSRIFAAGPCGEIRRSRRYLFKRRDGLTKHLPHELAVGLVAFEQGLARRHCSFNFNPPAIADIIQG